MWIESRGFLLCQIRFEKSLLRVRLSAKNDAIIQRLMAGPLLLQDKYLYSVYIIYE